MNKTRFSWIYSLLAVLSLSFVMSSCHKDDDDEDTSAAIIGTWQTQHYVDFVDGVKEDEDYDDQQYYQFNADGTFVDAYNEEGYGWETDKGTWKLEGDVVVIVKNKWFEGHEPWKITIKSINSSKLVWGEEEEEKGHVYSYEEELKKISALPEGALDAAKSKSSKMMQKKVIKK